jgi:hypothetical protein
MTMTGLVTMNGFLGRTQQTTLVSSEAKMLNEYISDSLWAAGGGSLRTYSSIWVDNNYQNTGSDRIISARLQKYANQCGIVLLNGAILTSTFSGTQCCLSDAFLHRQVILVSGAADNNAHWESRYVESINPVLCQAQLTTGQVPSINVSPTNPSAWIDGTLTVANLQILWLDHTRDELKVDDDYDGDGQLETRVVADRVIDLQAALGYDVPPWDWHIRDTGGNDDEWLFNASGDTLGAPGVQGLATAKRTDLRMIRFGVTVGSAVKGFTTIHAHRLLDGPTRSKPNWMIGSFISTVGLRNYDIMR